MTGRIFILPGYMVSATDDQLHYIGAKQLCALCNISPTAPNVTIVDRDSRRSLRPYRTDRGDVVVAPRYDGNYPDLSGMTMR